MKEMTETEKVRNQIISQFTQEMKKDGLYVAGTGGGQKNGKINLIDVCFDIHQTLKIEDARNLIVKSSISLLDLINSNEFNSSIFQSFPVDVDLIHLSILSTDSNFNHNNITSVSIIKGNIYYYKDNPYEVIKSLDEFYSETFEGAQKIVAESQSISPEN